jgi:hypothetical protein
LGFTFAFAATVVTVRQPVRAKYDNNFSALYSLLRKQARVNALHSRGGKRQAPANDLHEGSPLPAAAFVNFATALDP